MRIDFDHALAAGPFRGAAGLAMRRLDLDADIPVMHRWFSMDYARFWGLQGEPEQEVRASYAALLDSGHSMAFTGLHGGVPAFLVECYDPRHDELGRHYEVRDGDVGMHFFVGPPSAPRSGFTRDVFRTLMGFIFERLQARRVVVEPDARNHKVHVLNREMGFVDQDTVRLTHKLAALAFCTREQFALATRKESVE
jgi:RimJ/RimL family protein N-acetyltransferase